MTEDLKQWKGHRRKIVVGQHDHFLRRIDHMRGRGSAGADYRSSWTTFPCLLSSAHRWSMSCCRRRTEMEIVEWAQRFSYRNPVQSIGYEEGFLFFSFLHNWTDQLNASPHLIISFRKSLLFSRNEDPQWHCIIDCFLSFWVEYRTLLGAMTGPSTFSNVKSHGRQHRSRLAARSCCERRVFCGRRF